MNNLHCDATEIAKDIHAGLSRPGDIADSFISTIGEKEPCIRAFASFDAELVRHHASTLSAKTLQGPLAGVPIGVKDIIDTVDYPTEYFSPIYQGNRPSRDAHVVSLLKQAGAIVMGKTHTTEFAFMHTGPTRNPRDPNRTPGSSSAGSAAGLAAGFFPVALGTQTAGSLIKPAAYCGLLAFKPSFGLVSLEGVKPLAPSFDTIGWYGSSVRDLGLLASVLIPNFGAPIQRPRSLKLAFCRTPCWSGIDETVERTLIEAIEKLRAAGHEITELRLTPGIESVYSAHQIINDCEGTRSLWKEYQAYPELLSHETLAMIERARSISWSDEYAAASSLTRLAPMIEDMLAPFDVVLTASCGMLAPVGLEQTGPSDFIKLWTAFGLPQINIPLVNGPGALPVGLQLIAGKRCDQLLLAVAEQINADLHSLNVGPND